MWDIWKSEDAKHVSELVKRIYRDRKNCIRNLKKEPLVFHAESLFKALEYVTDFQPHGFASLTEARLWIKRFVEWYNNEHRHIGIHYVTAPQRHNGEDKSILAKRKEVYKQEKETKTEAKVS